MEQKKSKKSKKSKSQKVITTHALKLEKIYPEASRALINDTYMDDTTVSHPSEEECVKIVETLPKVTEGMDMKILKFYSNSKLALKSLPESSTLVIKTKSLT
jgi:hypothetical protein